MICVSAAALGLLVLRLFAKNFYRFIYLDLLIAIDLFYRKIARFNSNLLINF
jgi:hypothetical protein